MRKRVAYVAAASILAAALPARAEKVPPPPLAVYCAGATSHGFLRPDVKDSVSNLRGALAGKRKTLRLVDDPAAADLHVIVEGREERAFKRVFLTVVAGEHQEPFVGIDEHYWKWAADNAADQVDRWLKLNRQRILTSRRRAGTP